MEASRPGFYRTDLRTIDGEYHPALRVVQKHRYSLLQKFLDNERQKKFGLDHLALARTELGQTPVMLLLSNYSKVPRKNSYNALRLLLEKFKADPDAADIHGKTALMYALLNRADIECIKLLLKNGADPKLTDHNQISSLIYAAAMLRLDAVKLICPDYRAATTAALQLKFVNLDQWSEKLRASPRNDRLELPAQLEGSPKRNMLTDMSPLSVTPINGIRFRVSPSSPLTCSSSPLSMAVNQPHPSVAGTRRTSEDKTNTTGTSKSGTVDIQMFPKLLRRICSATFDSRLHKDNYAVLQFAQLTHNLCIYLEETDYPFDKTPEPLDPEKGDILGDISEEAFEKEPRRVSLPAASAPILIKSRSVEESINRSYDMSAVLIRALPREHRKNALTSGHLIERQGSAPQLQLKRRPRGANSGESSGSTSPVASLSRNATRQQISSPLVNVAGQK